MDLKQMVGINRLLEKFRRDVDDVFMYHFKTVNNADFKINLTYYAKSKVLKSVFNQVKKVLVRKDTKFTKLHSSNPDVIERFEIPKEFNGRVLTTIHKNVKAIIKEVNKDGIKIVRYEVEKCYFANVKEKTQIHIIVGGIYAR
jgi:hypothetical protein